MRMRMNHECWWHNSLALLSTCNVDVTYVQTQLKHLAGAHKALVRVRTSERRDTHTCVWVPGHALPESGIWQPSCYPLQRTGRVMLLTCHVSACPTCPSTRAPCPPLPPFLLYKRSQLLPMSATADGHVSEVSCLATFQHVDSVPYQPDQVRLTTNRYHTKMVEIANEFDTWIWIHPCLHLPTFGIWSGFALICCVQNCSRFI